MSRLTARNIKKHFDGVIALAEANFSIEEGEVCGLLGANGSGKTTLSRVISGIYKADGGEIYFDGKKVEISSSKQARTMGIAMAHQNLSLVSEMSVWENICLGNEKMKGIVVDNNQCITDAEQALKLFDLENLKKKAVSELSPSQKQLVEICKAIALNPKLLILDEPTAPLEFAQVNLLFEVIEQLKKKGTSIVFISHRMWEITQICDTVAVLRNGVTVSTLTLKDIEKEDQNRIIMREITGKETEQAVSAHVDRKLGDPVLQVEHLGMKSVLHDISFEIAAGEIVGISGLQGMGQEELLLVLSGHMHRDTGEITFKEKKIKWKSAKQAVINGVVLVPGDRHKEGLFMEHTVFDNLLYPEYCKKGASFFIHKKALSKRSDELMDMVSLSPHNDKNKVTNLSGGNQQKVVVGKWINQSPDVLLMSDPAKGIDVEARYELYEICKKFAQEGKSVLLYASDNHELIEVCDRILVMFEGAIVSEIPREEFSDAKLIEAALHMNEEKE